MNNPILEQLIYELRDPATPSREFRMALERIGEQLGIQIATDLRTKTRAVTTTLGKEAQHTVLGEQPVLVTILRAGLPLYAGLQRTFPDAEAGFVGAMRDERTLKATISYISLPSLRNKTVVLADTMIATGGSIVDTIKVLERQDPARIIVAGVLGTQQGIRKVQAYDARSSVRRIKKHNPTIKIYCAAVDKELNELGYIVPGLGDAGDRMYGRKL